MNTFTTSSKVVPNFIELGQIDAHTKQQIGKTKKLQEKR
jgi:hypothetical protein